ncbi:MAG: hypothetical protein AB8G96_09105 [Phycisphaerales bacterium]
MHARPTCQTCHTRPTRSTFRPDVTSILRRTLAVGIGVAIAGCSGGADDGQRPEGAVSSASEAATALDPIAAIRAEIDALRADARLATLNEGVGPAPLSAFNLPDPLIDRSLDRAIQEGFQDRFHAVYADRQPDPEFDDGGPRDPDRAVSFVMEPHDVPDTTMDGRELAGTARPLVRGFRAGIVPGVSNPADPWLPSLRISAPSFNAATLVANRLATDGVAATAIRAIALLLAEMPETADDPVAMVRGLREIGLPVDLLAFVDAPPSMGTLPSAGIAAGPGTPDPVNDAAANPTPWVAAAMTAIGANPADDAVDALAAEAATQVVVLRPSRPGFVASADDGRAPHRLIRMQPTRGRYWLPPGGGDSLDVAGAMLESLPQAQFVLSVGTPFMADALPRLAYRRQRGEARVVVIDEPHVASQWAQDNGQPGTLAGDPGQLMMLVPRFASRGDLGSTMDPGDTWMVEGLPAAGIELVRSPLLFQGGNLLVIGDPATGRRTLLAGDAEVIRNRAIGLRDPETIAAFRQEFAVDDVVVLAPPAFHLDFAVTVRRVGDAHLAFVHDEEAAIALVLEAGVATLERAGVINAATRTEAMAALNGDDARGFLDRIGPPLYARAREDGRWPLSFSDAFSTGPADSGIGNLDRFLTVFEWIMGRTLKPEQVPGPPEVRGYLETFARRDALRATFEADLEAAGLTLVRIPGFSLQRRSINTVNMVHASDSVLMPTTGGLYRAIDEAAAAIVREAVGPGVQVIGIPCGETQRRSGGIGCAVAAWPDLRTGPLGPGS